MHLSTLKVLLSHLGSNSSDTVQPTFLEIQISQSERVCTAHPFEVDASPCWFGKVWDLLWQGYLLSRSHCDSAHTGHCPEGGQQLGSGPPLLREGTAARWRVSSIVSISAYSTLRT